MTVRMTNDASKLQFTSVFVQEGFPSPDENFFYRGEMELGGFSNPLGDVTPIYRPSRIRADWDIVDVFRGAKGLPTSDFTIRINELILRKWNHIFESRCPITIHVPYNDCGDPDDFNAWTFKHIYPFSYPTSTTDPLANPLSGENNGMYDITGSLTALEKIVIFPIAFEEQADTTILAEAVSGFYAGLPSCGGRCGELKDECSALYVLTAVESGSPGLSSQLVWSSDDKQTYQGIDIPTLGGISGNAIVNAGVYILLVSGNDDAHHVIRFADLETLGASGWRRISHSNYTGVLLSAKANGSSEIYIGGAGGYVYKLVNPVGNPMILTDGSLTTSNVTNIDAVGDTVVATTDTGAVLHSANAGDSFSLKSVTLKDGSSISGAITSICILGRATWFVGVAGKLYYTQDSGDTYTEKVLPVTATIINDITFYDMIVGYMSVQTATGAKVLRSDTSGNIWDDSNSIKSTPTAERYSFVAPCGHNEVAIGGRLSPSGDGVLAVAS